jgi:hypothetical protein
MSPGQSITRNGGQRVELRPVSGTPSVLFAWSGTGLDALGTYKGTKGTRISWG